MQQTFYKYQGTGNDFVIIDNRNNLFDKKNANLIEQICNRRFGIGADGLILLEQQDELDFRMVYFNADGNQSTMCGNGGRCITAFAKYLGIIKNKAIFEAIDGVHHAIIENDLIKLQMQNVEEVQNFEDHVFLNTGSPHRVQLAKDLKRIDVKNEGAKIRYEEKYGKEGINVNFVEKINDNSFAVRTYERGVEDETLSCGTGVTAVALAMHYLKKTENNVINLITEGGNLKVSFENDKDNYKDIWLIGPAQMVFKGELQC